MWCCEMSQSSYKNTNSSQNVSGFDEQDLRYFMTLPAKKKLEYLEKLNRSLSEITPKKSKEMWERLKALGF